MLTHKNTLIIYKSRFIIKESLVNVQ